MKTVEHQNLLFTLFLLTEKICEPNKLKWSKSTNANTGVHMQQIHSCKTTNTTRPTSRTIRKCVSSLSESHAIARCVPVKEIELRMAAVVLIVLYHFATHIQTHSLL